MKTNSTASRCSRVGVITRINLNTAVIDVGELANRDVAGAVERNHDAVQAGKLAIQLDRAVVRDREDRAVELVVVNHIVGRECRQGDQAARAVGFNADRRVITGGVN